jgi:hypothetical protein
LVNDLYWILLGFFICITGAEIPDYDQLPSWKWLEHRSILTHSALIPIIIFLTLVLALPSAWLDVLAPLMTLLFLGYASHLFLDLFPVWAGFGEKETKDPTTRAIHKATHLAVIARWFYEGITGAELYKKMEGTYFVHLPFRMEVEEEKKTGKKEKLEEEEMKALSKGQSRAWYIINGLIIVALTMFSWNIFIPYLHFTL